MVAARQRRIAKILGAGEDAKIHVAGATSVGAPAAL
jgi:hypothetical protein